MRILLAEPEDQISAPLVILLDGGAEDTVERSTCVDDALQRLTPSDRPQVLVVGPSLADAATLVRIEEALNRSDAAVVLLARNLDTELLRLAMRSGVSDVLPVDEASPQEVLDAVRAAGTAAFERARKRGPEDPGEIQPEARVVTVFSTKGGVGKTFLSTNLGVALVRNHGKRVILLDLDLQFGDVGIVLGLEPKRTIHDAAQVYERLDSTMLEGLLVEHSSGVRAMLAPVRPEDSEGITSARVNGIIGHLRKLADYVVVDTSPAFSDVVLGALDQSDAVYVVTTMDVASIKNTKISMQKLHQLGYDGDLMRLVLNRADSKVFLEEGKVSEAIGAPIGARIPSDLLVPRSINKGVPVVLDAPKSRVARSIDEIARDVVRRFEQERTDDVA
ncbi:MAG: P-loop NTPase [Coriobacteriia bacterium]|nr:P-loop NTPase [Coriobacteriia bacterium]